MRERSLAVCTVVAKSHLPFARVIARSLGERHPDVPFFVLLADEVEGRFEPGAEPFHLLHLSDLPIPNHERFRFGYAKQPLSYAATPFSLAALLDLGFASAAFIKQESLVVGDLAPLFSFLDEHSIVLTPHLLEPLENRDPVDRELNVLQSGVFNIGFVGLRESPTARRFLAWWQDRVRFHCRHSVGEGMHYEQRWIDLVPAFFDDVHIVRDPGCNVAHWNLPERPVHVRNGEILVDGGPARLLRFSGYDPDRPDAVTRYSQRLSMADIGEAALVFERYRQALERAGWQETKSWPYAYGRFENGVPIPDVAREIYLDLGDDVERFGDPFDSNVPEAYFRWLNEPVEPTDGLSRLWRGIHRRRPDLQAAFPDPLGGDLRAFVHWAKSSGSVEHAVPEDFPAPLPG